MDDVVWQEGENHPKGKRRAGEDQLQLALASEANGQYTWSNQSADSRLIYFDPANTRRAAANAVVEVVPTEDTIHSDAATQRHSDPVPPT